MEHTAEKDAGIWTLCPDCPHVRHSRPCTHQVRGMQDVYRDCGCVTSPADPFGRDERERGLSDA